MTVMLKLPPPVWAFVYAAVAGGASAAVAWRSLIDLRVVPLGGLLLAIGLGLGVWAARLFRSAGTELNPTSAANRVLVTHGPYRFTRNPMYLGLVVFTLGLALAVGSLPMFAVPALLFLTVDRVHIPFEEAKMRRQFGAAFDDYTARVRRWL
jgi:protein-S-isoprenylcysteine O-methyltransferase Ste14